MKTDKNISNVMYNIIKADSTNSTSFTVNEPCNDLSFNDSSESYFYQIKTNLGNEKKPFFVTEDLGHFSEYKSAYEAMSNALEGCQLLIKWHLVCNGKTIGIFERSNNNSLSITVAGSECNKDPQI